MIYQGGVQGFPRASHAPILGLSDFTVRWSVRFRRYTASPPVTGAAVHDPNLRFATANCRTAKDYSITSSARAAGSAGWRGRAPWRSSC